MFKEKSILVGGKEYKLISSFRDQDQLREAFYELPKNYFSVDFKTWYERGYWGEYYNPYCIMEGNQIVSNVGVCTQKYNLNGTKKKIVQLGGVATREGYKNRGLSRYLIEHIINQYESECDAICLFANDSVTDFYPKFGFEKTKEYRHYTWLAKGDNHFTVRKLDYTISSDYELVKQKSGEFYKEQKLAVMDNTSLLMFYWEVCKAVELYYIVELDAVVAASYDRDCLRVSEIYGDVLLSEVIEALIKEDNTKVVLEFTPKKGYLVETYRDEDTTFFVYGKAFKEAIEKEQLRMPAMSHT